MKKLAVAACVIALCASAAGCSRSLPAGPGDTATVASASPTKGDARAQADAALGAAIDDFGFDLLRARERNATRGATTVISPISVHAALAMTANGASGATLSQMRKALHLGSLGEPASNSAYANLIARLNAATDVKLAIANSLWLDQGFPAKQAFLTADKQYFGAEIHSLDLQAAATPATINAWVSSATRGKITKLFNGPLPSEAVLDLINATYFKGDWADPFDANATSKQPFHLPDGSTTQVPMMHSTQSWAYSETPAYQAIRMPYKGDTMSMIVVLPSEDSSLDSLVTSLTAEKFAALTKSLAPQEGALALPKVEVRWDGDLNSDLKALGMPNAFASDSANFSRMSAVKPLWIDDVLHKTYLRVDEKGTEAAAVTSVQMKAGMAPAQPPFQMTVDRPYLMALVDNDSGTVLFLAAVRDPRTSAK